MNLQFLVSRITTRCRVEIQYVIQNIYQKKNIEKPPIFIVGCGHSGTSLLLSILGTHSHIFAIPYESNFAFHPKPMSHISFFNKMTVTNGKTRWVEKTPKHITCISTLLSISPDAKILLMLRDGRDVACSLQDRRSDRDLKLSIERWVQDNESGEKFWQHPNVYLVRYEDLVTQFRSTLLNILSFINEDFESELLEYHKTPKFYYSNKIERPVNFSGQDHPKYRNWQINQPLFDGRGKWKRLTSEEKEIIKYYANEMLQRYGYIKDYSW